MISKPICPSVLEELSLLWRACWGQTLHEFGPLARETTALPDRGRGDQDTSPARRAQTVVLYSMIVG